MNNVIQVAEPQVADASRLCIEEIVQHATHLLPAQGPIKVFVHHNTLHAFEDKQFEEGVIAGLNVFGGEPYFSEARYREELQRGRILQEDLEAVLIEDLGEAKDRLIANLGTKLALRLSLLQFPISQLPDRELEWMLAESNTLWRFHDSVPRATVMKTVGSTRAWVDQQLSVPQHSKAQGLVPTPLVRDSALADDLKDFRIKDSAGWSDAIWEAYTLHMLWQICQDRVKALQHSEPLEDSEWPLVRHSGLLAKLTGVNPDSLVHEVLIRFCSAYIDQGFAAWEMPGRERGLLNCFVDLYSTPLCSQSRWMDGLQHHLRRIRSEHIDATALIIESLRELGVSEEEHQAFIESTLLALGGWAGMIWQMESKAPWTPRPSEPGSLLDFLAVRLLLDRLAIGHVARSKLGVESLDQVRSEVARRSSSRSPSSFGNALSIFQITQAGGMAPAQLAALTNAQWSELAKEIASFDCLERRRILHLAYERNYRIAALDALQHHTARRRERRLQLKKSASSFQVITCIDDREESFRRHLEEVAPQCETFGAAGFFAVVMYYRGAAEAHYRPLCPINIVPRHYVTEEPVFSAVDENLRRSQRRRLIGRLSQRVHSGSRTAVGGLVTAVFGSIATFPLVARILAPNVASRIRRSFGGFFNPPATELHLQRETSEPGPEYESLGYTIEEMAGIVVRVLQDIGLVKELSPLVLFLGHGSSSLNNPHESAYNCGACSGGRGGPNARAFARMANDMQVRKLVHATGIAIPDNVRFLGGYHNTCNDRVEYYDLDQLPHSHRKHFRDMEASVNEARRRNALERSRRFESASLTLTPAEALQHVEQRSEDLSQARPEYNHATNALCFVGEREWSRGLFLDRRAFLASYDPSIDDSEGRIVERILQAAIPVCGGISLEYYFSTVDPEVYGCGSKLPHNITSLAGVMTGAASDLRPGLSAQMVEIHEPLRILFVVQTTPEIMLRIVSSNQAIRQLVENNWVQLALVAPETSDLRLFQNGSFVPYKAVASTLPTAASSIEWFRGSRQHLGFASIQDEAEAVQRNSLDTRKGNQI